MAQQILTVDNASPRRDTDGQIVDAHDGRLIRFGDRFFWYGTAYGNTNGFVTSNHYRCYSSEDMIQWRYEGKLLSNQPKGVYYRPHVIYNSKTKKYVLWYNWYPRLWDGQFGVAVSDTPEGPFEIVNDNVEMANSAYGLGDFGLFVDDDGTGYISYNTIRDHMVSIEKLTPDYLGSTMENGGIIAKHVEAGSQFRRNGKYYLLTDYTCCFCNSGSGARVYISDDPLSEYQFTGNINRYPGRPAPELYDSVAAGTSYSTLVKEPGGYQAVDISLNASIEIGQIELFLFTGNRKGQCGEVSNPRVHPEFVTPAFAIEIWNAGEWNPIVPDTVSVSRYALGERLAITFRAEASRIRIKPDSSTTPFDAIYINEVQLYDVENHLLSILEAFVTGDGIRQDPIIPAQQNYVMELRTGEGTEYIWMGDLWGSASDNIKGHDYQYWSAPLKFNRDGTIDRLKWHNQWKFIKPEDE